MAMTFSVLTGDKDTEGSIKYFVRHSIVPSESILTSAQSLIYSMLRVREMKVRLKATISAGEDDLLLPTNFIEPVSFWRGGAYKGKIRILDEEHFEQRVGNDENDDPYEGMPTECTMDATKAYFNVTTDIAYPYRLWYMATPAPLSLSNESNFMCTRYPHILEAMCKYYAYQHRQMQNEATNWLAIANAGIEKANGEYDLYRQQIQHEITWEN